MPFLNYFKQPALVLLAIWIFLTAINIGKPFQMDDGFHMEAAKHIAGDPLHPMSGLIRWDNDEPEPIHHANQPPLFFYMIAGLSVLFGFNEVVMHLLVAFFSFLALYWFYKTCVLLKISRPLVLLALFGLNPAFVVNQNVMTDVPLMSLIIGALYYLLRSETRNKKSDLFITVVLLSIALFIKYTVLPVIAAAALWWILQKQYRRLWWMLVPIGLLLLWTLWNYWEFGGSHLLGRKPGTRSTFQDRFWTYFTCIGCIATFGGLFLSYFLNRKLTGLIWGGAAALFAIIAIAFYKGGFASEPTVTLLLEIAFFVNGLIVVLVTLLFCYKAYIQNSRFQLFIKSPQAVLVLFSGSLSLFVILFAPFMGIRHILLIIPFILILAAPVILKNTRNLIGFSMASSVILSLLLGISDWKYAFYYKNTAAGIMKGMPPGSTVWATGTGAWQWYAQQNGMIRHSLETEQSKPGDFLVIAKGLPAYRVSSEKKFAVLAKIWGEPSPLTYFCVSDGASFYSSMFGRPGWKLSKRTMDTIYVCQYLPEQPTAQSGN